MADCSFCGKPIVKGKGLLFVKKDGSAFYFCSGKCEKNLLLLKRSPHHFKWTAAFHRLKETEKAAVTEKGEKKAVKKVEEEKRAERRKKRAERKAKKKRKKERKKKKSKRRKERKKAKK